MRAEGRFADSGSGITADGTDLQTEGLTEERHGGRKGYGFTGMQKAVGWD